MLLKEKSKALKKFKIFKTRVKNKKYLKINYLRSNKREEFTSKKLEEIYKKYGIKKQCSVPKTPQQNRFVERKNKTVQKITKSTTHKTFKSCQNIIFNYELFYFTIFKYYLQN